jgi:hypothetical protein
LRFKALLFLFCLALVAGFSCHQRTKEDAVLEVIDSLTRLAEQKDLEGMMSRFAEDFVDFEGRDNKELRSLLSGYFGERSGIVAHKLSHRVIRLQDRQAGLEVEVALSSGGAEALRRLVRVSPDIYRIRIDLMKDGGTWLISYAEWSGISLTELLPESASSLKKLFPKL